jgi:alpha-tubulin suppressor-like RCC1 family protein
MFDVLDVTGGTQHTCARLEDTTARCWGSRLDGRIGDSSAADGFRTGPTTVGAPIRGVVELTAGGRHTCMLHDWGAVRCWGDDALGQVGDGVAGDNLSPTLVQGFGA